MTTAGLAAVLLSELIAVFLLSSFEHVRRFPSDGIRGKIQPDINIVIIIAVLIK